MALGSWQGLYNSVIDDLMDQKREQELLLLMAIARFADPLGFAFPGRARLMKRRNVGKDKHLVRENWLVEQGLLAVEDIYDPRKRQEEPHYQISPYVLYVRDEFLPYCLAVFMSERERDFGLEKSLLVILSREKESQPDSLPESEPDAVPEPGTSITTRKHNQTPASKRKAKATTTGNARRNQPAAANQPPARQNRKRQPPGGATEVDEFSALLSPTVDDSRIVSEIQHVATTTEHQASELVRVYPREALVHWLRVCAMRRSRGELKNPGGWFFKTVKSHTPLPIEHWPLWAQQQKSAQDDQDDLSELEI